MGERYVEKHTLTFAGLPKLRKPLAGAAGPLERERRLTEEVDEETERRGWEEPSAGCFWGDRALPGGTMAPLGGEVDRKMADEEVAGVGVELES